MEKGIAFSADDKLRGEVIQELMCRAQVDLAAVASRHGADVQELLKSKPKLEPMEQDGLIRWHGTTVEVTPRRPAVRAQRGGGVRRLRQHAAARGTRRPFKEGALPLDPVGAGGPKPHLFGSCFSGGRHVKWAGTAGPPLKH